MMRAEQRKYLRKRNHYIVRVQVGDGLPLIRGMLSEVSERGARLSLASESHIPTEFTMIFPASGSRQCRKVWRSGQDIGVEFVAPEARTVRKFRAKLS